jgi:SAP domain
MDIDTDIDPRISALSYRELQAKCKEHALPATGKKTVLQKNLQDYLDNPRETLKRLAKDALKKKNGFVDWKNHAAKEIFIEDLEPGGWLHGVDDFEAEEVYNYYKATYQDIFDQVPFKQFETKYYEGIKKAAKRRDRSAQEEKWLEEDRKLYPRQTHNHRGEPVFDMDEAAKSQLKEDIENKLHKKMEPIELWQFREVYRKYKLHKFRRRIYQYERRVKFLNYLEKKQKEKRNEFEEKMNPKPVTFERVQKVAKSPAPMVRVGKGPYKRSRSSGKRSGRRTTKSYQE